jgi:hypothetical protein
MVVMMTLALLAFLAALPGVGPAVGEAIPAFELVDQEGRRPKGLVLVFFRSADW